MTLSSFTDASAADAWRGLSGKTLLFPVVGHPVAQVRAPAVFNAVFAQAGIDALAFGLDLPPDSVATTVRGLLASATVGGVLVTVPYKKVLCAAADHLGTDAAQVGSLNALRRGSDGLIQGDLFDGAGFLAGLLAAGHTVAGRRVLLLGAGGAGSAIAAKLGQAGAATVAVYDPQARSAQALVVSLQAQFALTIFEAQAVLEPRAFDIIINASPLGLRASDPLPVNPAHLADTALVCDIIMEPATTRWLQAAAARGLAVHRGRHMLDHQLPAYLSFFGLPELAARLRITSDSITLQETP